MFLTRDTNQKPLFDQLGKCLADRRTAHTESRGELCLGHPILRPQLLHVDHLHDVGLHYGCETSIPDAPVAVRGDVRRRSDMTPLVDCRYPTGPNEYYVILLSSRVTKNPHYKRTRILRLQAARSSRWTQSGVVTAGHRWRRMDAAQKGYNAALPAQRERGASAVRAGLGTNGLQVTMAVDTELHYLPATRLRELILARELSPVDATKAVLDRIHAKDPKVHAMVTVDHDGALEAAKASEEALSKGEIQGPLHGIPVTIKDLFPTKGLRTTYGSKFLEDYIPDFDDIATSRLRESGAIIIGKTNTPAFGHKDMCDNLIMEATRNPWALDRTSGASSGGAGAAASAGFGPLALGSDGAGSIRIPAALCGVYGIKPSFGRVPFWPSGDYWGTRSHVGPMTRTVRDAALMLSVMAGPDERDPLSIDNEPPNYLDVCQGSLEGMRIAWSSDFGYAPVDTEVRELTAQAVRRFEELGAEIVPTNPAWDEPKEWHAVIYRAGLAVKHGQRLKEKPEWVDDSLTRLVREGQEISTETLLNAQAARARFYDQAREFMSEFDLLVTPTMPIGAWKYDGQPHPAEGIEIQQFPGGRWPFMFPFNVLGWPAATVPCGFTSDGLPVGLQIVAPWHRDDLCLRASAAFEQAQPWHDQTPPL